MNEAAAAILSNVQKEIWVLTAAAGGQRGGLVATFVSRLSIVPHMPRVVVGLSVRHHTTDLVRRSAAFALHLLSENELDWVWHFGLVSGRGRDKLRGFRVRSGRTGAPILTAAPAQLECRVETSLETGDRTVFLADVVDAAPPRDFAPLTVDRLRQLGPADKLARMDELVARDAAVDAELIDLFRRQTR